MSSEPTLPDVTASAGPLLLGYLFNWGLYGVLFVQVYIYYQAFPEDTRIRKVLVVWLFALETLQTVIVAHDAFVTYASGFGNLDALENTHLEWLGVPILSGVISATVQIFYAFQVSVIWKSKLVPCIIVLVALLQSSSAITAGIQALQLDNFQEIQHDVISPSLWLVGSACCDIIIAISMTYALTQHDTRFKKTRDLVTKLIRLTIETGTLTATIAVVDAILFLAVRDSDYHITPALILAKLYSNTLLVKFNTRITISHEGSESHSTSWSADIASTRHRMVFSTPPANAEPHSECIELGIRDKCTDSMPNDFKMYQ